MLTLEISRHIQQYADEDCLNEWGWLKNIFILHKKRWQCTWKSAIERLNNIYICTFM